MGDGIHADGLLPHTTATGATLDGTPVRSQETNVCTRHPLSTPVSAAAATLSGGLYDRPANRTSRQGHAENFGK